MLLVASTVNSRFKVCVRLSDAGRVGASQTREPWQQRPSRYVGTVRSAWLRLLVDAAVRALTSAFQSPCDSCFDQAFLACVCHMAAGTLHVW
jgi:hypothetical protein